MMIATPLAPSLQLLIDRRLDNIERALMSTNTPRSDRRLIVSAVEDQILEMLSRLDHVEPTRDDVIGILASLDPPEAYAETVDAPVEQSREFPYAGVAAAPKGTGAGTRSQAVLNPLAVVGLGMAIVGSFWSLLWWFLGYAGLMVLGWVCLAATVCGIVSLCQIVASKGKQRGHWMSIVACCSLPIASTISAFVFLLYS